MQAVAAEFPGCAEKPPALFELRRVRKAGKSRAIAKRRRILLLFREKSLKHFVSIHLFSKPAQHHIPSQPGSAQDWSPPGYGAGLPNPQ